MDLVDAGRRDSGDVSSVFGAMKEAASRTNAGEGRGEGRSDLRAVVASEASFVPSEAASNSNALMPATPELGFVIAGKRYTLKMVKQNDAQYRCLFTYQVKSN